MTPSSPPDRGGDRLRILVLGLLFVAPLAAGATLEPITTALLLLCSAAGALALLRARAARARGAEVRRVAGARLLVALHLYVLGQLIPLPPRLLKAASPGSFSFYNDYALVPLTAWRPVSVSPGDTLRGLFFVAAFSLLYVAVYREFGASRWRRRLVGTVLAAASVLTAVTLVQDACPDPRTCAVWPRSGPLDTYGPFGNRHHFAGCLVMAINLALGLALEALQRLTGAWGARRRGWLALGGPEAAAFIRRLAVALLLLVGLLTSKSRGGVVACAVSAPVLVLALRRRLLAAVVIGLLVVLVVAWVGIGDVVEAFQHRGIKASRVDLWEDMFRMFPQFPLFGVGWDAFGMAYRRHQTVWRYYFVGEAHNEYLQVLLELGIFGFPIVAALFFVLFRRAFAAASRAPLEAGILASLLGLAFHNLVDFNWQIPASAATYVALAGLAMRGSSSLDPSQARI